MKEGRKKGKDTKAAAKKKRAASSENESHLTGAPTNTGGGNQTNKAKKQKVNQEKEARKGQKVNFISLIFIASHFYFYI